MESDASPWVKQPNAGSDRSMFGLFSATVLVASTAGLVLLWDFVQFHDPDGAIQGRSQLAPMLGEVPSQEHLEHSAPYLAAPDQTVDLKNAGFAR